MAWNGENINPFINMERLHESQFPDGLALLLEERDAKREQRELRAAIKASKKAYNGMKIALEIEQNFSSPANVRGTTPESSGDSSSESSNGHQSPRAPGKLKPKPVGRNASSDEDDELIEAAIAQAQAERDGLESSGSNGGESPRAPRKEKKPKAKKELAKRAKEIRRLRVT